MCCLEYVSVVLHQKCWEHRQALCLGAGVLVSRDGFAITLFVHSLLHMLPRSFLKCADDASLLEQSRAALAQASHPTEKNKQSNQDCNISPKRLCLLHARTFPLWVTIAVDTLVWSPEGGGDPRHAAAGAGGAQGKGGRVGDELHFVVFFTYMPSPYTPKHAVKLAGVVDGSYSDAS